MNTLAARLWQYTGRQGDSYGRLEASEAAAGTASRILTQSFSFDGYDEYDPYAGYGRLSRRNSAVSLRGRSLSRAGTPFDGYGTAGSMYDNGSVYGGSGSAYGGAGSVYGGAGSVYGDALDTGYDNGALMRRRSFSALGSSYAPTTPMTVPAAMTPSMSYAQPMQYTNSQYAYGTATPGYAGSSYGYAASTPSVTVVQAPSSSRHRSHSRHRSSRSSRHRHRHGHGSHGSSYYVQSAVPYGY